MLPLHGLDDTIAALASAPGPAPRGIVRVGGPDVLKVLAPLFAADGEADWRARRIATSEPELLRIPAFQTPVPARLYLWPTRRSYTGQPLAEFHTVGSPPLLEAVLEALFALGARPARPGEFTLRAFLAGRIDLTQAEAVLGVIDAHDHAELESALAQLAGGLSRPLGRVRSDLLDLLADLEAGLDFVDDDIEFVSREQAAGRLAAARAALDDLLRQASDRMLSAARPRVVLAGLPNAGKSTLFNALAKRDAALVSPLAGTTRDWLRAETSLEGLPVELIDTAGWEAAGDDISRAAQQRRREQSQQADLVLWCTAADLSPDDARRDETSFADAQSTGRPCLRITTKHDLAATVRPSGPNVVVRSANERPDQQAALAVSAVDGAGLPELNRLIAARLGLEEAGGRQIVGATASRARESLASARAALDAALGVARSPLGDELIALELRAAIDHLGRILGAVYTDDLLDRVFSRFCIGK